jgi:two-component sensor histidine kinase
MLTALVQPEDAVAGLQAGATDYLAKPFFPDELLLRIAGAMRRHHAALATESENDMLRNMLALQQRELGAAQQGSQSETLMRHELLHNVTIHLQSLVAIIESELRRLSPGTSREAVQRIRTRVRGAALVYQVSEALQSEPVVIGDIVNMTAGALKAIYRPWKRIVVEVEGGHVELPAAVASPVAMLVNELLTNCFKHAFPDNRFGTIKISYGGDAEQFWLRVADDGVGFDAATAGNGRATLTQLVAAMAGQISWSSSSDGTAVELRVPVAGGATA